MVRQWAAQRAANWLHDEPGRSGPRKGRQCMARGYVVVCSKDVGWLADLGMARLCRDQRGVSAHLGVADQS